jgi:hypothetical protein
MTAFMVPESLTPLACLVISDPSGLAGHKKGGISAAADPHIPRRRLCFSTGEGIEAITFEPKFSSRDQVPFTGRTSKQQIIEITICSSMSTWTSPYDHEKDVVFPMNDSRSFLE